MTSRTFVEHLTERLGEAPPALTGRSGSVYHPPAIRVRSQGHPSVIGEVVLLLKG
jgi:hypothetical protein